MLQYILVLMSIKRGGMHAMIVEFKRVETQVIMQSKQTDTWGWGSEIDVILRYGGLGIALWSAKSLEHKM